MIFTDQSFFILFPLLLLIYYRINSHYRVYLLVFASYIFLGISLDASIPFILLFSTLINYFFAIKIDSSDNKFVKKKYLIAVIIINIMVLVIFKYIGLGVFFNSFHLADNYFFNASIGFSTTLGISFFTYQGISYVVDVYKKIIKPEINIERFALYLSFFPKFQAGPIERGEDFLPQLHLNYTPDYKMMVGGLRLILWGAFKKILVADRLAIYTSSIFNNPDTSFGLDVWFASWFFGFQILCDFSAYSDIAIGVARLFGINLSKNFGNRTYFVDNYRDHWQMVHLTFSHWLRDYILIPIFVKKNISIYWGIFFTMIICGMLHNASLTFILWGAFHGIAIILAYKYTLPFRSTIKKVVFSASSIIPSILFASQSFQDLTILVKNAFIFDLVEIPILSIILRIGLIIILDVIHINMLEKNFDEYLQGKSRYFRWSAYLIIITSLILFSSNINYSFAYYQF